jgi:hypothetical protein
MTDFTFSFTEYFDYSWSLAAGEFYDSSFSFDPVPPQGNDPNSPASPHHRRHSTHSSGSTSPAPAILTNKRSESDPSGKVLRTDGNAEFDGLCQDPLAMFNARELGFIPSTHWEAGEVSFGALVSGYFQKKSGTNTRFFHKLYNALKISEIDPIYTEYVGIEWVADWIIKIDKKKFARLLGIRAIEGSLFHRQGNFPSHGFREVGPLEARRMLSPEKLANVDYDGVRLLVHAPGHFMRESRPEVFEK